MSKQPEDVSSVWYSAWALAHAAYVDGRLDNLAFKHKQLFALFEGLQKHGVSYCISSKAQDRLCLELEHTLRTILAEIEKLPRNLTRHYKASLSLEDAPRNSPTGVVVVVIHAAHPFASWALPLAQAVIDGNAVLVASGAETSQTVSAALAQLDGEAYHMIPIEADRISRNLAHLPQVTGVVGAISALRESLSLRIAPGCVLSARIVPEGPVPIIVDQSTLPGGKPLSAAQERASFIPGSIKALAQELASCLVGQHTSSSLGFPAYLLVHENVAQPLHRALRHVVPASLELHHLELYGNRTKARNAIEARHAGHAAVLLLFSVRSIDMAIDFIQNDTARPSTAYVFARPSFGAYAFNSLSKTLSSFHINEMPASALALGPFKDPKAFRFTTTSSVTLARALVPAALGDTRPSLDRITSLRARRLMQKPGHRIDFFGGSFLFAGGMTALTLLGGTSYLLYRMGTAAWSLYMKHS